VGHEVAADLSGGVGDVPEEELAWGFDGTGAEEDSVAMLAVLLVIAGVEYGGDVAGGVAFDAGDEGAVADLCSGGEGCGEVSDVHAGLGTVAAALVTVAAMDAGLAM